MADQSLDDKYTEVTREIYRDMADFGQKNWDMWYEFVVCNKLTNPEDLRSDDLMFRFREGTLRRVNVPKLTLLRMIRMFNRRQA